MKYLILFLILIFASSVYSRDEYILEIKYKREVLNSFLSIIDDNGKYYVSLEDFFIDSGWYISKKGPRYRILDIDDDVVFDIDFKAMKYTWKGEEGSFSKKDFIIFDGRHYLFSNFVSKKMLFKFSILKEDMSFFLDKKTIYKTPMMSKIDRAKDRNFLAPKEEDGEISYNRFNPNIFTPPSSFHTFGYSKNSTRESTTSSHRMNNEILGFEASFGFDVGIDNKVNSSGVSLSRYDANGVFPELDITEIQLFNGAFYGVAGAKTVSGTSDIMITNGLRGQQRGSWGTREFRGRIDPGWEVELYVNKRLVAIQKEKSGEYYFKDIRLLKGSNEVELVFIGPNGEIKKDKNFINIQTGSQFKNKTFYSFSFNELDEKRGEYSLLFNTPISDKNISMRYGIGNSFVSEKENTFGSLGVNFSVLNLTNNFNFVKSKNDGNNFSLLNAYRKGNYNITLSNSKSNNFLGNNGSSHSLGIGGKYSGTIWGTSYSRSYSDNILEQLSFNLNSDYKNSRIGYSYDTNLESLGTHSFNLRNRVRDFSIVFGTSYTEDFNNYDFSIGKGIGGYFTALSRKESFASGEIENLLSLSKSFGNASIGGSYSHIKSDGPEENKFSLNFNVGFGNVLNPLETFNKQDAGGIEIIAFLDTNNNGSHDEGEIFMDEVLFLVDNKNYQTDKNGSAKINNLSHLTSYSIELSDMNIDYISKKEKIYVTPFAGSLRKIYYPIHKGFEIEGVVKCGKKDCSGIVLKIDSVDGKHSFRTYTTSGGYFYKDKILMGDYKITVLDSSDYKDLYFENLSETLVDNLVIEKKQSK